MFDDVTHSFPPDAMTAPMYWEAWPGVGSNGEPGHRAPSPPLARVSTQITFGVAPPSDWLKMRPPICAIPRVCQVLKEPKFGVPAIGLFEMPADTKVEPTLPPQGRGLAMSLTSTHSKPTSYCRVASYQRCWCTGSYQPLLTYDVAPFPVPAP